MNTEASNWRTDAPPKDGTKIVAIGNISEDCGDGRFDSNPFTEAIQWDGDEWINEFGLTITPYALTQITIFYWLPFPQ